MDSFYDVPRRPPAPICRDALNAVPVVPEISVLCSSNVPKNKFVPYHQWKQQNLPKPFLVSDKENVSNNMHNNLQNNSILKKTVRFESPTNQQLPINHERADAEQNMHKTREILKNKTIQVENKGFPSFEQMYMANIPSRQLDLSVIDFPKRVPQTRDEPNTDSKEKEQMTEVKEKSMPKTYKEFLETQKRRDNNMLVNDSVTDIFNYKRNVRESPKMDRGCKEIPLIDLTSPKYNILSDKAGHRDINREISKENYWKSERTCENQHQNGSKSLENVSQKQNPISNRNFPSSTDKLDTCNSQNNNLPLNVNNPSFKPYEVFSKENYDICSSKPIETQNFQYSNSAETTQKRCDCDRMVPDSPKPSHNNALKVKSDDDLSARDLLKIIAQQSQQIAQQNTQLLLLQQQVSEMFLTQKKQKSIENRHKDHCFAQEADLHCRRMNCEDIAVKKNTEGLQDRCITSTQHEQRVNNHTPKKSKNHLPNFAIGLTTSFEVSFRRPRVNEIQKNKVTYEQDSPRIQEITETESTGTERELQFGDNGENYNKETLVDQSMVFKEPIRVRETCPSPEPSIKINMADYDDSDSDDSSSQVEGSLYRNLMAQVNKILHKAQLGEAGYNVPGSTLNNRTIHKVKEATLKHLRKIGVDLPNFENSCSENSSSSEDLEGQSYAQEDISFAVKQLLMKYLPADHLAKLATQEGAKEDTICLNMPKKTGAIRNRPEFSFATLQYMKKYNLISNNKKEFDRPQRKNYVGSPKILDISKLKQQPKLL